jgi:AroM protein.
VAPLSPYDENDPAAVRRAADALRAGQAGLVVMDCIGFRRKTRDEIAALTGAPTLWWRTCSWPAWPRSSSAADP